MPIVRGILHDRAKQLIVILYSSLLVSCAISFLVARWSAYRRGLIYLVVAVAVSTSLVALLKDVTHVTCPWSVDRYGGDVPYLRSWQEIFGHHRSGRCFPSGHASSGFALVALYFYCRRYAPALRWYVFGVAIALGAVFGVAQQLRGAHYLSHDVWALAICWFVAVSATPILGRGARPQ